MEQLSLYNSRSIQIIQSFTSVVGTVCLIYLTWQAAKLTWIFVRPSKVQHYNRQKGSWALVTGSSDGIGLGFAEELLERGFNVLLHGRNETKLRRIQSELSKNNPERSIDFVTADASKYDDSYSVVVEKVKKLPGGLTVLINNVGGQTLSPTYVPLRNQPHEYIDNTINVNLRWGTHLTKDLIPILRENGTSLIVNLGSSAGMVGVPYIVPYSGAKAYVHAFTRALKNEMAVEQFENIDIQGFLVGNVRSASNIHDMPLSSSSRECAASCLDRVGGSEALVWPSLKQAIPTWFAQSLPQRLMQEMVGQEMKKRVEAEKKSG